MRIGCLQFAPQVGDVDNNLTRADAVLSKAKPEDLDILVLPEMAFSGYNFKSLHDISPFLEPSQSGITSLWARTTALKYNCPVAVGYPEKVDMSHNWPTSPEYYNSLILVNEEGETIANYRKTHLYYTDETWALENPKGFYQGWIPGLGQAAIGICMDLNPYRFETPWSAFEFAFHALDVGAHVVIISMAWLTREDAREFSQMPKEPDMDTLTYWVKRLEPLIRSESDDEVIVIFANRTGVEGDAVYAGTSAVLGIKSGEVNVYGLLGRGEKELLVVDTKGPPFAQLVYRPGKETAVGSDDMDSHSVDSVQKTAAVPGAEPTSPSAVSRPSPTSRTQESNTDAPDKGVDIYNGGASGRSVGDSASIPQVTSKSPREQTPATPTPVQESPGSASYFCTTAGPLQAPRVPHSQTSSTRSNHADSPIEPRKSARHLPRTENSPYFARSNVPSPAKQSPRKVASSRENTLEQVPTQGRSSRHPDSPGSSKHSRSGNSQRADPKGIARPNEREPSERSYSKGVDPEGQSSALPDLDKLGADMLIFEEGTHPKRDSLVCHPDEDEFVVSDPSGRVEQTRIDKKEPHLSHKGSRHMRNRSVDPEQSGPDPRSSPRRTHTPKPGSPRIGRGLKNEPSHPSSRASSSRAKRQSPEPPLPDARNSGLAEEQLQRSDVKRSPRKDIQKPSSEHRSSPAVRSPQSKGSRFDSAIPRQQHHLPVSRFKTPGPDETDEIVQMWIDQSNHGRHRSASASAGDANTSSATKTVEIRNSPSTPRSHGGAPRTPKAMVLIPEADDSTGDRDSVTVAESKGMGAADASIHSRPRNAVR